MVTQVVQVVLLDVGGHGLPYSVMNSLPLSMACKAVLLLTDKFSSIFPYLFSSASGLRSGSFLSLFLSSLICHFGNIYYLWAAPLLPSNNSGCG